MTFVVVAKFIDLMIPVLDKQENMFFIKKKGPKGYFYYNGDLDTSALCRYVKKLIATELSYIYVLECYGMYKGMMDFSPYLKDEVKDKHPYYNNPKKELSDQELETFLFSKGLR